MIRHFFSEGKPGREKGSPKVGAGHARTGRTLPKKVKTLLRATIGGRARRQVTKKVRALEAGNAPAKGSKKISDIRASLTRGDGRLNNVENHSKGIELPRLGWGVRWVNI